jgi:NodT family efflux transporter outer membrane factor (OMF) lipoprotein
MSGRRSSRTGRLWALLGSAGALVGCAVGPDYHMPPSASFNAPSAQGRFAESDNVGLVTQQEPVGVWWKLYRSPDLDRLIAEALTANTNLRVAEANLQRSQAMVRLAQASGQPQVGFEGGYDHGLLSAESLLSFANLPDLDLYSVNLSFSYEVDLFGRIKRGIEAAKADHEAVEAARDWVRVTVAAAVTQAYVEVCSTGDELQVARHAVELQQQNHALTRRLQDGGRAGRLDETRSRTLVEQLQSAVPPLEARQRNGLYQLAVLTGRPPEAFEDSLANCAQAPPIVEPIPVGDGASLLRRRPDVRAAERLLRAATAEIGVETADLYPRIALEAKVGSTGVTNDVLLHRTDEWLVGPVLSWNLNQSAARARITAAKAEQKAQLARFDGVVLGALREVESALNTYRHDLAREDALKAARDDAATAAQDAHELESHGRTGSLATLDAERTLANADLALASQRAQVAQDQVSLFLSLGGGW